MDCICSPAEINGRPFVGWIGRFLGDCVYTEQEVASVYCGIISLFLCEIALFPQIYKNFIIKSVKGISFYLLLTWALGDLANLLGTIFNEQLQTQKITAIVFFLTDIILITQYFIYYKPIHEEYEVINDDSEEETEST